MRLDSRPVYVPTMLKPRDLWRILPWYSWAALVALATAAGWFFIPVYVRLIAIIGGAL